MTISRETSERERETIVRSERGTKLDDEREDYDDEAEEEGIKLSITPGQSVTEPNNYHG